ncbi:MAG: hypothetical protein IH587_03690 [Anaerolineae bacterium]|nr:hypothetical protein [Anaerolineae bacterium]
MAVTDDKLQALIAQIDDLPLEDRLALVEAITHRIRIGLRQMPAGATLGALKPSGDTPTDEQIHQDYIDHLDENYR